MIHKIEELFIEKYIVRKRRERLRYELSTSKRRHGLGRFCHTSKDILIENFLHPYKFMTIESLYSAMINNGAYKDDAHIMGISDELDGRDMPLYEALNAAVFRGAILVIAKEANIAYFETEPDYASEKFLIY